MTITSVEGERQAASKPRRWRWVLLVCAVVVAAAIPGSIWLTHERSNLHLLVSYPMYGMSRTVALGETLYLGSNLVSTQTIDNPNHLRELSLHVSDIRVEVVADSGDADIEVLRCVLAADGPGPEGDESGRSRCASLSPFRSGSLRLGFKRGDDDLVIAMTLRRHGEVRIAGLRLHYSSGWRHGTQHVGVQASETSR